MQPFVGLCVVDPTVGAVYSQPAPPDTTSRSPSLERGGWTGRRLGRLLAMRHFRLAHSAEARQWLDKAEQATTPLDPWWNDPLELSYLLDEARSLIWGTDPSAGQRPDRAVKP